MVRRRNYSEELFDEDVTGVAEDKAHNTNSHSSVPVIDHGDYRSSALDADDDWPWGGVNERKTSVNIELTNSGLRDQDLPCLLRTVETILQRHGVQSNDHSADYVVGNLDLSANAAVTDEGVEQYLAPFLAKWPMCRRVKLYKTSIGDRSIQALTSWMAAGHAHELHLSDLGSPVASDTVAHLLRQIQKEGQYPYRGGNGAKCALWLRLEHNGIKDTDKLVKNAHKQGVSMEIIAKKDLGSVRPGKSLQAYYGEQVPDVQLVLFHEQGVRNARQRTWQSSDDPIPSSQPAGNVGNEDDSEVDRVDSRDAAMKEYTEKEEQPPQQSSIEQLLMNAFTSHATEKQLEKQRAAARGAEVIAACPDGGDSKVSDRWREHLEWSDDPEAEALRILKMTTALCAQGFICDKYKLGPSHIEKHPSLQPESIATELDAKKLLAQMQVEEHWKLMAQMQVEEPWAFTNVRNFSNFNKSGDATRLLARLQQSESPQFTNSADAMRLLEQVQHGDPWLSDATRTTSSEQTLLERLAPAQQAEPCNVDTAVTTSSEPTPLESSANPVPSIVADHTPLKPRDDEAKTHLLGLLTQLKQGKDDATDAPARNGTNRPSTLAFGPNSSKSGPDAGAGIGAEFVGAAPVLDRVPVKKQGKNKISKSIAGQPTLG